MTAEKPLESAPTEQPLEITETVSEALFFGLTGRTLPRKSGRLCSLAQIIRTLPIPGLQSERGLAACVEIAQMTEALAETIERMAEKL